jgi:glyoxylase-like metal-dependent hydrolase (beta-lactamase superfamily II)
VRVTPGHVPYHQSVLVSDGSDTLVFLADLIPTSAHLPLPWIMGYDVEPLRTLESRRAILRDAVNGGWLLLFEHDARVAYGRAVEAKGGAALMDEVPAPGVDPA